MYLTDGVPIPSVGVAGSLLLPRLHIGLGREDVQVHLGERGGGPAREGFPLGLWGRLQAFIVETIAGDLTNSSHLQSGNLPSQLLLFILQQRELRIQMCSEIVLM